MQFIKLAVSLLPFVSLGLAQDQDTSMLITVPVDLGDSVQFLFETLCSSACNDAWNQTVAETAVCAWCDTMILSPSDSTSSSSEPVRTFTETSTLAALSSRAAQQAPDATTTIVLGSSTLPVTASTISTFEVIVKPTTVGSPYPVLVTVTQAGTPYPVPKPYTIHDTKSFTVPDLDKPITTMTFGVPVTVSTTIPGTFTLNQAIAASSDGPLRKSGSMKISALSSWSLAAMTLGFFMA